MNECKEDKILMGERTDRIIWKEREIEWIEH